MKTRIYQTGFLFIALMMSAVSGIAQCSICTKTASQMGREAGLGLNQGVVYLMGIPFLLMAVIGYNFYKGQRQDNEPEA